LDTTSLPEALIDQLISLPSMTPIKNNEVVYTKVSLWVITIKPPTFTEISSTACNGVFPPTHSYPATMIA